MAVSTTFYPGQKDYIEQLNLLVDSVGAAGSSGQFLTSTFRLKDPTDATKQVTFDLSGLPTATTRTYSVPNLAAAVLATTSNLSQTFAGLTTFSANVTFSSSILRSTQTGISAAGTTQGTATALTKDFNVVSTVAASSGVVLPTAAAGAQVTVKNAGANALAVYPASGGTIDALAANAAFSIPVGETRTFGGSSATQWYTHTAGSGGGGDMVLASVQTISGAKTFSDAKLLLAGATSGAGTLKAPAVASTYTWTLPAATTTVLGASDVVDNLTGGGSTVPLSAAQGVVLKALCDQNKLRVGSGAPASGLGVDGEGYMRTDKPYLGALYIKASGAWSLADNSYSSVAAVPTASATYAGCVVTVTDSTYAPTGIDLICVTYDGGTSYFWRPVSGKWPILQSNSGDVSVTGVLSSSIITAMNFTMPNRTDIFPPNLDIDLLCQATFTGSTNGKTFDVVALALSGTGGTPANSQVLITTGTSYVVATQKSATIQNRIHLTAHNAGYSHPSSAWYNSVVSGDYVNYSGTWAGLLIQYRKTLASASDSMQFLSRSITLNYPM